MANKGEIEKIWMVYGIGQREQVLVRHGNLWWTDYPGERAMYVYYQPTHWREVSP